MSSKSSRKPVLRRLSLLARPDAGAPLCVLAAYLVFIGLVKVWIGYVVIRQKSWLRSNVPDDPGILDLPNVPLGKSVSADTPQFAGLRVATREVEAHQTHGAQRLGLPLPTPAPAAASAFRASVSTSTTTVSGLLSLLPPWS